MCRDRRELMHREIKREKESVCVERYKACLCRECVHVERGERECVCTEKEIERECVCVCEEKER